MDDTFRAAVRPLRRDACEVSVAGELDVDTAPELRAALAQAMATYQQVTVDLAGLRFCDCTGLGALLAAARTAKAGGAELRLRSVPDCVARLARLFPTDGAFSNEQANH
ncbi:STAS domain-containing protein [Streptomyces sp. IBSNAI002]|uniref:STAS domain-containing protein n=1 Tax=Streptomyces sp. IBSNAI002 TaxID=3457500 RepID=UPI003FD26A12